MGPNEPKLKLSDVLGALVSSIASARNVADVEALRIADRYRQHELLRGLPVPRLRFSRVAITLPVIIRGVVASVSAEPAACSVVAAAAAQALREEIDALATEDTRAAQGARAAELEGLEDDEADAASAAARRWLLKAVSADPFAFATFEADLQREIADELLDLRHASGDVPPSDTALCEMARETSKKLARRLIRRALLHAQTLEATPKQPFDPAAARQRAEAVLPSRPIATLLQRVSEAAQRAAVVRPTGLPDLDVIVDTDAVKNAGAPAAVTQLHLTLLEEGLEWVGEEQRDGSRAWKLMQE